MVYPSISEYKEAVQYAESFETSELKNLRPVINGGEPVMTSGNFAVVFKMQNEKSGEYFALKCFTQDQNNRAEAYNKIIEELRYVRSPYFIELEYINEGIWAGDYDNAFPVLLMPWVEGESLDVHISKLVDKDPERLHLVAYEFSVMASWLVNQPFAHGDIKPDNIIVREDGSMVLVDYDGLFVPSMRGNASRESGTPSFRHPNRPSMPFDEKIDDFPLASINLSLYLIALNPSLLKKYGAKDRLLFSEIDYMNLADCKLLDEMSSLFSDAQVQRLYALFLIALSEGCLQKCENTLMLLRPPHKDFKMNKLGLTQVQTQINNQSTDSDDDLVFNVNCVQFKMKYVEGGIIAYGVDFNSGSKHEIRLDNYYIGETSVTQELWEAIMGYNPSHWKGDKLPVETVSWDDCQVFIKKLNSITGKSFSLPTERQWKYAARGGNKSKIYKYIGSDNIDEVAWHKFNSEDRTHEVATKKSNELGLYDMAGNVCDWCNDKSEGCHTICGESFHCDYIASYSYYSPEYGTLGGNREGCHPETRSKSIGLRLVLNPTPQDLEFNVNGVKFTMKYVEGGSFMMGALDDDDEAYDNEKPSHKVNLDSYYIGETQVTQALWQAVMGSNRSYKWKGDKLPVETVSWNDCQEFIKKLNIITGKNFSLPTEAQWEFAARGGNKSRGFLYSGSNNIYEVAWYVDNCSDGTSGYGASEYGMGKVAVRVANELGLYDMSGNVWEWCIDWYDSNYYKDSPQDNPQGPDSGELRVLRGGSYEWNMWGCRVSCRLMDCSAMHKTGYGLRLVLIV